MNFRLKLKYKKIIFAVSLGTMAIGLAILSINTKSDVETSAPNVPSASSGVTISSSPIPGDTSKSPNSSGKDAVITTKLQKNAYPEVNSVVTKYMEACMKADMDTLENIVSEVGKLNKADLERRYEYIEAIKNIDCYTLPGLDENTYIVYVYHESKLVNIETMAPGLIVLYVSLAADGNYVIMLDPLDEDIKKEMTIALKRQDVQELIKTVNKNMEQAKAQDANLKKFEEKLSKAVEDNKTKASPSPAASKAPTTSASPQTKVFPKTAN